LIEVDQPLLAARAESRQPALSGDLALGSLGDLVWIGGTEAFPERRGGIVQVEVAVLLGQRQREGDEGVRGDRGSAIESNAWTSWSRREVPQR